MRRTMGFEQVVDSIEDDLANVSGFLDNMDDCYAVILKDDARYYFDLLTNEDGEPIVSSDPIFETEQAVRDYLKGWVSDIQCDLL